MLALISSFLVLCSASFPRPPHNNHGAYETKRILSRLEHLYIAGASACDVPPRSWTLTLEVANGLQQRLEDNLSTFEFDEGVVRSVVQDGVMDRGTVRGAKRLFGWLDGLER